MRKVSRVVSPPELSLACSEIWATYRMGKVLP